MRPIATMPDHVISEVATRLVEGRRAHEQETVPRARNTNNRVTEISSSNVEQSPGIGEVQNVVGELDQVTQKNSALAEQSAVTAESLKHQAAQAATLVGKFAF